MGRWGNRTYGEDRPGTKTYVFKHRGWAGFGWCPKCDAPPAFTCIDVHNSDKQMSEPHPTRGLVKQKKEK